MSISSEITRLSGNVSAALTAISQRGVTVPSGSNSDDLATLIAQMPGGHYPLFTMTLDNNGESVISIICNKTYSECVSYYNGDGMGAILLITTQDASINSYYTLAFNQITSGTGDIILNSFYDGQARGDIVYHSNGTIEQSVPSSAALSLTATSNGTYTPSHGAYTSVTVNVPSGAGAVVVTEEPDTGGGVIKNITAVDISNDTVDAAHLLYGYTAHDNTGTAITGQYVAPTPSLQAKTNIDPSTSSQTVQADSGYDGLSSVQINAMPSMTLPTAASASSSGTSKATITPTSSAQYLNIPTGYNAAAAYYTIAAASGASNFVTGTFTGTTTGAAMDVTLNYSGSGYPIVVVIFPTEGPYNSSTGTFYSLVKRYACVLYSSIKSETNTTPAYAGSASNDKVRGGSMYKSSSSNSTSVSFTSFNNTAVYNNVDAESTSSGMVKIKSKTKMSVYIASSSYGFAANIEYTYHIIYSS